ncbi:MAG: hypothetical protein WC822_06065 [Candidatus Paceibacterota bacterium]|jgi:hypothetical protein
MGELVSNTKAALEMLSEAASGMLTSNAPVDTGRLAGVIGTVEWDGEFKVGVGPLSQLGGVDDKAPSDTIKNFLEWYRKKANGK